MNASDRTALVVGATGGIGRALVDRLVAEGRYRRIVALSRRPAAQPSQVQHASRPIDLLDEASIAAALRDIDRIDLAIVATGLLHDGSLQPEKSWRSITPDQMARLFAVNATGPMLVAKQVIPRLPRDQRAAFAVLSARVGSISDNRLGGWYGYRASKAALNQLVRTLAIELARSHKQAVCIALHPGTVDTPLSRPFQGNVPPERLFTPDQIAAKLLAVIERASATESGSQLDFDGKVVPA